MNDIIIPGIFRKFPEIVCGISKKSDSSSGNNMSYMLNDDPKRVKSNRNNFFDKLNIDASKVCYQKQTHSIISQYVSSSGYIDNCDAIYTDFPDIYLAVSIADCIPVLLYEPYKKIIGGIHSGWKGTKDKIVHHSLLSIKKKFNISMENLYIYIGPGISTFNFEVGNEVWQMFEEKYRYKKLSSYYIDLKTNIYDSLIQSGVNSQNIEVSSLCTYDSQEMHSYRRDKNKSGRMIAVIGRKPL